MSELGDKVWVLADDTWQWASYEFRITNSEPLGQHSVFLSSGGGRRVLCGCKVLTEKPADGLAGKEAPGQAWVDCTTENIAKVPSDTKCWIVEADGVCLAWLYHFPDGAEWWFASESAAPQPWSSATHFMPLVKPEPPPKPEVSE